MDYVIADKKVLPETDVKDFSEAPIYLPNSYQINDCFQRTTPLELTREQVGLPANGCVYCVFNKSLKFDPETTACWMRVLRQVPDSTLWLLDQGREFERRLRSFAEAQGVAPERLVFAPFLPRALHLRRMGLADLFLDTPLYNAHTSASDALWAEVPVLTLVGSGFHGRVGASLLCAVGLDELITTNLQEYERLAVALGGHEARRKALAARLADTKPHAPLFDTERTVRALERGYLEVWAHSRDGAPPRPVDLTVPGRRAEA
jgi:predicted O-linked N-acetylglucosamine transferase (SPINDLY family)